MAGPRGGRVMDRPPNPVDCSKRAGHVLRGVLGFSLSTTEGFTMIDVLPGEISDPDHMGHRCDGCGRPMFGSLTGCTDGAEEGLPTKAHLTLEAVPLEKNVRWFTRQIWSVAFAVFGMDVLSVAEWLCSAHPSLNGARPVDVIRAGRGMSVLELQFADYPQQKALWTAEQQKRRERERRAA